jgi:Ni/Co efflux regulator RcnB
MHVMLRLPHVLGMSLLAASACVAAEGPLPDPIAPAVIGRPLDEIRPVPARPKPAAARPKRSTQAMGGSKAVAAPVTAAAVQAAPTQRVAKQAVDDRADARAPVPNDVGKGSHFARKRLAPGAYLGSRHQAMVRKYYEGQPASRGGAKWTIGEPLPAEARVTGVPNNVRAALPAVPPGHQYVQVDGEVVLLAVQSRMVVDGVSRAR